MKNPPKVIEKTFSEGWKTPQNTLKNKPFFHLQSIRELWILPQINLWYNVIPTKILTGLDKKILKYIWRRKCIKNNPEN